MSIKYYDKSGATPEEKLLAGVSPVDAILNGTSKNAIQNKAVYNALKDKLEAATTDLIYYYTVHDVYNKSEVRALIGAVETLTMEVVSSLLVSDISTTTIYLLKPTGSSVYDEYVYISDAWVKIGTTDMDLSGYMLTADFNVAIADYFTKAEINNLLNSYYTKTEIDADFYDKDAVDDFLDGIQDTIDDVETDIDNTANDIYEVMGKNGAKNLLPNTVVSKTQNGITYTVNNDGTVSVSGTASAHSYLIFPIISLKKGTYIISGCPDINQGETKAFFYVDSLSVFDYGNGAQFTLASDNDNINTAIRVNAGVSFSSTVIFKPMIRLAEDTDSTYQPYAMTNQQMTPYVQSVSNPNLLDNPWFTVNQRGQTTYTGASAYCVDRWYRNRNNADVPFDVEVTSDGITVTKLADYGGRIWQKLEPINNLVGRTVTMTILYKSTTPVTMGLSESSGGAIPLGMTVSPSATWKYATRTGVVPSSMTAIYFALAFLNGSDPGTFDIKAVKLELGPASTLEHDIEPNYQQELAKCQRYFQRIKGDGVNKVRLLFGLVSTTTTIQVQIPFVVPMRISNATITYPTNGILYGKTSTTTTVASGINTSDPSSSVCRNCLVIGTGLTVGEVMPIYLDVGAYIDLSADL